MYHSTSSSVLALHAFLGEVRVVGLTLARKSKKHHAVKVYVCYKEQDRLIDYIKIDIIY